MRFQSSALIAGIVYCNALSLGTTLSPSALIAFVVTGVQKSYLSGTQQQELSLNGLTAVSQYSVYCSVVTSVGSASNATAVKKTQKVSSLPVVVQFYFLRRPNICTTMKYITIQSLSAGIYFLTNCLHYLTHV